MSDIRVYGFGRLGAGSAAVSRAAGHKAIANNSVFYATRARAHGGVGWGAKLAIEARERCSIGGIGDPRRLVEHFVQVEECARSLLEHLDDLR